MMVYAVTGYKFSVCEVSENDDRFLCVGKCTWLVLSLRRVYNSNDKLRTFLNIPCAIREIFRCNLCSSSTFEVQSSEHDTFVQFENKLFREQ